jgi:hypothetical protein
MEMEELKSMKDKNSIKKIICNEMRFFLFITIVAFLFYCFLIKKDCVFKGFVSPINWWKWLGVILVVYILIRLYKEWILKLWKFLKENKIVHVIFFALLPLGIIFFAYTIFFPKVNITIKNQVVSEIKARLVESNSLIGFYASLIAVIGVLITLAGRIIWKKIQEAHELTEELKKVEDKVNFLAKENVLADWAKEKIDNLGLLTFKIENYSPEDQKKLKEIKRYMTQDLSNKGWLELFWAHHIMTEEMDYEKVQNIIEIVEKKLKLISKKEDIWPFFYHFRGQFNSEKYRSYRQNSKYDFFYTNSETLKKPSEKARKYAISILNESIENYKKAIIHAVHVEQNSYQSDPSRANIAVVLIELSKFYYYNKYKCKAYLDEADSQLEEVSEKDHSTYYGLARVHYYKGDMEKAQGYFEQFQRRVELFNDKEKFIIRNRFEDYIDTERIEFAGKGFPSRLFKNTLKKTS